MKTVYDFTVKDRQGNDVSLSEYKCICEGFKRLTSDPEFEGLCHCGLYFKEK